MGVKLFVRGTRKITLTNEGVLLRRRAEEILELVDKTEKELTEQEGQVEGVVAIGCGDVKSVQKLPELIRTFHDKYPLVTFDLYTATADYIKERMDHGLTDIGLLLEPVDLGKYDLSAWQLKRNVLSPCTRTRRWRQRNILRRRILWECR